MAMEIQAVNDWVQLFKIEDCIEYRLARKTGSPIHPNNSYARYLKFKVKGLSDKEIRQKLALSRTSTAIHRTRA